MRPITVSTVQLPADSYGDTAEAALGQLQQITGEMLELAGQRGSDLVLLGEASNLPHHCWRDDYPAEFRVPVPGPWSDWLAGYARSYEMNLAAPVLGLCDGVLRNVTLLFDRQGRLAHRYYKAHLPIVEAERWGVVPAHSIPVFGLDIGRVGVMTCMDVEYPEHAQVLLARGAEVILFPHAQQSWGEIAWEIRYRARAIDTGLYIVSANYGYPPGEWTMGKQIGRSGIVGPDGTILADAARGVEVVTRTIDLDRRWETDFHYPWPIDRTLAVLASRRPELYGPLTDPAPGQGARARVEAARRGVAT